MIYMKSNSDENISLEVLANDLHEKVMVIRIFLSKFLQMIYMKK
jgi:hypothetical protein